MNSTETHPLSLWQESFLYSFFKKDPIGFIDIGARGGFHSLVDPLHEIISFLGFEPDPEECTQLNQDQTLQSFWNEFKVLPFALSNTQDQQTLNILSAPTNSSLLEPNPTFVARYNMEQKWKINKKITVNTTPLDHVIYDLQAGFQHSGEILKLDTQGTEHEILEGANKLLSEKTVCVVTEVEFFPIYNNQKLFSDVELLLRKKGFSFYGFLTEHTRSKKKLNKKTNLGRERLFYADAVFFKDPLSYPQKLTTRQWRVLLFAAILSGFYDFALELVNEPEQHLEKTEITLLSKIITHLSYKDPQDTKKTLDHLVNNITHDHSSANVLLGKYIDALQFPDFEDCN